MATFPAIERYRAELKATSYISLNDPELARIRQRYAEAQHSNAIEGIHSTAEQIAFTALMIELRVPAELMGKYTDRFVQERIIGRVTAGGSERPSA